MNRPSFRRQHRYRNGLLQGTASAVAVGIFLLLTLLVVLRLFVPGALGSITRPLWGMGTRLTSFVGTSVSFQSSAQVRAERDRLSAENVALAAQNAALSARAADLMALLGSRSEPERGIVASVLARPPVAPYDVLIIDQGAQSGVLFGAPVFGAGGTPVGTVGEVDARGSRVTLFSTSGIRTEGWAGAGRVPITLVGAGGGAFRAEVARDAGIAPGDGVYVAAGGAFPVGTVTNIESNPSSPSVSLDVRPYANPFSLTWVTVGRP